MCKTWKKGFLQKLKKELELDLVENRFTNASSTVTSKNTGKLENITDCIQMQA